MKVLFYIMVVTLAGVSVPQVQDLGKCNRTAPIDDSIAYNVRKIDSNHIEIRINDELLNLRDKRTAINQCH